MASSLSFPRGWTPKRWAGSRPVTQEAYGIRIPELLAAAPDTTAPVSFLLAETGLEA